ncbi:MAG: hypothetical protein ACOYM2_05625 [Rectinemataceae bacterium]
MRRWQWIGMVVSVPLFLSSVVWQSGRCAASVYEARLLEEEQHLWIDLNRNLIGSIAALSNRERAARSAERLGLVRAGATRRIFIEMPFANNEGRSDG